MHGRLSARRLSARGPGARDFARLGRGRGHRSFLFGDLLGETKGTQAVRLGHLGLPQIIAERNKIGLIFHAFSTVRQAKPALWATSALGTTWEGSWEFPRRSGTKKILRRISGNHARSSVWNF